MEAEILRRVVPTAALQKVRSEVFQLLRKNIEKCLARYRPHLAVYGSWPLQTTTQCGDLDVTILVPQTLTPVQVSSILASVRNQMEFVAKIRPAFAIRDILEVDADVRVLKFWVKGVAVDMSVNQTGGLLTLRLMEYADTLTEGHLFKRTLLLVKAWAMYEARIAGSRYGLLTSYALGVMTMCVLNTQPQSRSSPFQAFECLLNFLSSLDWPNTVVTCFGPLSRGDYSSSDAIGTLGSDTNLLFTPKHLETLTGKVESHCDFQWKSVNVADPLRPSNNIGRSVSKGNWERIKLAIEAAQKRASDRGIAALFPTVLALPLGEDCEAKKEVVCFTNEMESVQKALRGQISSHSVPIGSRSSWWQGPQPRKVTVANQ